MLRPTRAGWCFFIVVFGVGFAALNTGNNLLYLVLSLMLAFLGLSGVMSESALRGIAVRRLLPREVFAGAPNPVVLEIANHQRRVPSFAIVVEDREVTREPEHDWEDPETRSAGRVFALRIDAGATERRRYALQPEKRGEMKFEGFRVSTRFPFGLFLKSMSVGAVDTALVYPALERVSLPRSRAGERSDGDTSRTDTGHGAAVTGVREYVAGDPMRRIHWKTSVRRGELLVRELEDERDAEVEVLLRTAGAERGEAFEQRVRWAASEVVAHLEAGLRVALRTDREHLAAADGPRQRARLLAFLARVQPDSTTDATTETATDTTTEAVPDERDTTAAEAAP